MGVICVSTSNYKTRYWTPTNYRNHLIYTPRRCVRWFSHMWHHISHHYCHRDPHAIPSLSSLITLFTPIPLLGSTKKRLMFGVVQPRGTAPAALALPCAYGCGGGKKQPRPPGSLCGGEAGSGALCRGRTPPPALLQQGAEPVMKNTGFPVANPR
jgi:hypothetical protein